MSKVSESFSSFDRGNLKGLSKSKLLVGFFSVLLLGGGAVVAASPDVSIGQNGIQINTGSLDVNGNDIKDAGTTIWDASAGNIATAAVDYSAATASDVGLGNADNADELDLDGSESMNANLNIGTNRVVGGPGFLELDGGPFDHTTLTSGDRLELNSGAEMVLQATTTDGEPDVELDPLNQRVILDGDGTTSGNCIVEDDGMLNCDGSKNWVHDIGNGKEAVYTSQESPEVRAVYEGQTQVENGATTVGLPSHFEKTVSNTQPMLRVQATPHELATVAVTERSDSSLTIEASKDVTVDYRVTGIREGYEDKQVVRPKKE